MPQVTLFIQVHGRRDLTEMSVADAVTPAQLHAALAAAGISLTPDASVFVDEDEQQLEREGNGTVRGIRHGCRIHVARCRRINATVHYLDKTTEKLFPPGTRVRTVKAWVVRELKLDRKDVAEHVLQLCQSTERPASDTALHTLVHGKDCTVCFDFVPEQRVEG
jgi:hypothetical protein